MLLVRRAAYAGNHEELRCLLEGTTHHQNLQFDSQGNTALHVAVLRRQHDAIRLLLDAGMPPDVKNARRWNPMDEAVALGDAEATKLLYS
jgi:ankyrin repeat protein